MNFAHIHLIINHIPFMTMPVALVFLLFALLQNNQGLRKFSLIVLALAAGSAIPVYFTGAPAEKVIEHLPGILEQAIEAHEDAAEISLIVTLAGGALAIAALIFSSHQKVARILDRAAVLICTAAICLLGYTASLGGKVHHPEASNSTFKTSTGAPDVEPKEGGSATPVDTD